MKKETNNISEEVLEVEREELLPEELGEIDVELMEAIKLDKTLKKQIASISHITRMEMKATVDLFYQLQHDRIALENQIRAIKQHADTEKEDGSSSIVLDLCLKNMKINEANTAKIIETLVQNHPVGQWLLQIKGIGPVLAGGLIGYFDVTNKEYASQFMSYAGLNDNNRPWLGKKKSEEIVNEIVGKSKTITDDMVVEIAARTQWSYKYLLGRAYDQEKGKWKKDKLIAACAVVPYNKKLKMLMYKVGSSFQWNCNKPDSLYGQLFNEHRVMETQKNERGEFAEQAKKELESKNYSKSTEAYKCYTEGKLPKAHINMRCLRWVEKLFVSHLFEEMYRVEYDKLPPRYYALEHCDGHHDEIEPEVPYHTISSEIEK